MYWRIWCKAIGLYRPSADFLNHVFGSIATHAPISEDREPKVGRSIP
jgi:hypothetical protein